MKISKQARRDAKSLFQTCRVNGMLDEARVRQTVALVVEQKPRGYVGILSHFQRLMKLDIAKRTVRVENAVPTSGAMMESIKASLAKRYGPGLDVTFGVNPALLGGMRVKVGSDVYDGSVQARLGALADNF
ncbi:MAG: H(+)-transporting ATPase [Pedosphaera sp.]|nr:H(+)-transporting ATPase [Pedosphaera sp.]